MTASTPRLRTLLSPAAIALLIGMALALTAGAPAWSATPTAEYELVFDATWSSSTHPVGFPGNPHFSGLVGGIHSDAVSFWEEGQLASLGIERMAEWGLKTVLESEVSTAIGAGTALAVISGGGIGTSPGSVSVAYTASQDHPLLTITSMLAPSPDWFVGVDGLELFNGSQWVQSLTVDLYVYDAGTDDGATYTAPDQEASPHQPIFLMSSSPFDNGVPVGTFTITRTDAPPTGVPGLALPGMIALSTLLLGLGRRFGGRERRGD